LSYEFSEDLYYDFPDNSVEAEGTGNGNGNGNALPPTFLSVPLDLTLNEGSRLRLPCRVDRLQGFVLLWKKAAQIIAIGSVVIAEVNTFIVSKRNRLVVRENPNASLSGSVNGSAFLQRGNIELEVFLCMCDSGDSVLCVDNSSIVCLYYIKLHLKMRANTSVLNFSVMLHVSRVSFFSEKGGPAHRPHC
jgi:hypothetical protein